MYEELIIDLRNWSEAFEKASNPWGSVPVKLLRAAADAIEELQEDNAALNGTVSNLIGQIAELSKPRWIPTTEKLPDENGYYLTYVESALFPNSYYFNLIKFIDGNFIEDHCVIHRVTHWMPLPEPPKEET